ncbi:MAG: peptidylprolyl isomerase [bacterium]|nr:peptidylprolyl isomerase [bacterium]
MRKYNKPFLVLGLMALVFTLSACGTSTPDVNDNVDLFDEGATPIATTGNGSSTEPDKKLNLGDLSVEKAPDNNNNMTSNEQAEFTEALSSKVLPPDKQADLVSQYSGALIKTNMGDIKVEFYKESPMTVNNFMHLAQAGFYDGSKFHRVIKDFMVQGGDPNSKDDDWSNDGFGGPGYYFKDEINEQKLVAGSLAMANSGAGTSTNGSQFFIVTAAATPWLDGSHTNFGRVTVGMDVVRNIENVSVNGNDHPTEDMVINSIELLK